jgi:hypothetical protein
MVRILCEVGKKTFKKLIAFVFYHLFLGKMVVYRVGLMEIVGLVEVDRGSI